MGPNAQYGYGICVSSGSPNGGTGGYYMSMASDTNQFGMGVQSPYSPPNNGGPGNPGTANQHAEANASRFNGRTTKIPAVSILTLLREGNQRAIAAPSGIHNGNEKRLLHLITRELWSQETEVTLPFCFSHLTLLMGVVKEDKAAITVPASSSDPREDNYYRRPNIYIRRIRSIQYGYAGQSQQLGRYIPPMMTNW